MAPLPLRRAATLALVALGLLTATGCGSDDKSIDAPSPELSVAAAGSAYTTRVFEVPLTVTPSPVLAVPPIDATTLLSWDGTASANNKVRFLVPVEIYPPGKTKAEAVPADFAAYLKTLAAAGARLTATKQIQVDGHPATLTTVSRTPGADLDGSFGCAVRGDDRADDCYAPQADLLIRLAAIKVGDKTVLASARVPVDKPDQAFIDGFEQMLTTVKFR